MNFSHQLPPWASPTQLEIVGAAIEGIESAEARIESARSLDVWPAIKERFVRALESEFPDQGLLGSTDLDARLVSRSRFGEIMVENVVFHSVLGWEINGTLFRPATSESLPDRFLA